MNFSENKWSYFDLFMIWNRWYVFCCWFLLWFLWSVYLVVSRFPPRQYFSMSYRGFSLPAFCRHSVSRSLQGRAFLSYSRPRRRSSRCHTKVFHENMTSNDRRKDFHIQIISSWATSRRPRDNVQSLSSTWIWSKFLLRQYTWKEFLAVTLFYEEIFLQFERDMYYVLFALFVPQYDTHDVWWWIWYAHVSSEGGSERNVISWIRYFQNLCRHLTIVITTFRRETIIIKTDS